MNSKLNKLIEKHVPELKEKIRLFIEQETHKNYYLTKYKVLEIILGNKLICVDKNTAIHMYYGIDEEKYLTEVDFIIANILFTLQGNEEVNIFQEYEKRIKLGSDEPEYDYLIEMIDKFLEKNK